MRVDSLMHEITKLAQNRVLNFGDEFGHHAKELGKSKTRDHWLALEWTNFDKKKSNYQYNTILCPFSEIRSTLLCPTGKLFLHRLVRPWFF